MPTVTPPATPAVPPTAARASSLADLPNLSVPLPMQVKTETGNEAAKVRWLDQRDVLFWCANRVNPGRDLLARLGVDQAQPVDIIVRVMEGESPVRLRDGYLHAARWMPKDEAVRLRIVDVLRAKCPEVFAQTYTRTKLPKVQSTAAEVAAKKARALAILDEREAAYKKIETEKKEVAHRVRRRVRNLGLVSLAAGAFVGLLGMLAQSDFRVLRLLLWKYDPARALEYGVLEGASLIGEDFVGAQAVGASLSRSRLVGSSFADADLTDASFANADLTRTIFTGTNLTNANLSATVVHGARFDGANLRGTAFQTDLSKADFRGAVFDTTTRWPDEGSPRGSLGPGANAQGLDLLAVQASGADLSGMNLVDSKAVSADLSKCNLTKSDISGAVLTGANLEGADLTGSTVKGLDCAECRLGGANLSGLNAERARFTGAVFLGSTSVGMAASGARFDGASFGASQWSGTDLRKASFHKADLGGAVFKDCVILGADFREAVLGGSSLQGCIADATTVWPTGFDPAKVGVVTLGPKSVLVDAKLPVGTDLSRLDLTGIDARRLRAESVNFEGAKLASAQFTGAVAVGGNFSGATLTSAQFVGADLASARFVNADLGGANFEGALLCGADFSLSRIERAKFKGAAACASTKWPMARRPDGVRVQ